MGATFQKIEAYLIFTSEEHMKKAFEEVELDPYLKEISSMIPFVNLNNTYLFTSEVGGLPYSSADFLKIFFSELVEKSYWGQYFIESQELEMDLSDTKPLSNGLQTIEPNESIDNIPNFSNYFTSNSGWKKFENENESFLVNCQTTTIDNKEYFYFDKKDNTNYFPWILTEGLLQIENNKVYIITAFSNRDQLLSMKNFDRRSSMKEVFATSDSSLNKNAYILSEESGFYFNKFLGIVKEINLNGTVLSNCLELYHDYIHVDCYKYIESDHLPFENYLRKDYQFFSYWQIDKGLVAISSVIDGVKKDFIGTETMDIEPANLPENKEIPKVSTPEPPKKPGFFGRLFSKK